MARILIGLATLNSLIMLGTFAVGFICEGRVQVRPDVPLTAAQRAFTIHLMGGLASALLTLLLHSLIFTYFIGTGRWVQEVVKAYRLPATFWERARRLKLQVLPAVLGSIALVTAATTLGAATDTGFLNHNIHLIVASLAVAFSFWSYVREYFAVSANSDLLAEIMAEVNRMRSERGLT